MSLRAVGLFVSLGLVLAGLPSATLGVDPPQDRSLDDRLLDELNADPIDEVDRELFGRKSKEPQPDAIKRELGEAGISEDENPLLEIARLMQVVERQVGQADSGPQTQQRQKQIVDSLNELIKQARKVCQQAKPSDTPSQKVAPRQQVAQPRQDPSRGGQKRGSKPAHTSNARPGQADAHHPNMGQMRAVLRRLWGKLPQRAREQMLELPVEQFLPKYELMIEEYFKRLAEEKGVNEG